MNVETVTYILEELARGEIVTYVPGGGLLAVRESYGLKQKEERG